MILCAEFTLDGGIGSNSGRMVAWAARNDPFVIPLSSLYGHVMPMSLNKNIDIINWWVIKYSFFMHFF